MPENENGVSTECDLCKQPTHPTWVVGLSIDEIFAASLAVCDAHLPTAARTISQSGLTPDGRLQLQDLNAL